MRFSHKDIIISKKEKSHFEKLNTIYYMANSYQPEPPPPPPPPPEKPPPPNPENEPGASVVV